MNVPLILCACILGGIVIVTLWPERKPPKK